VEITKPNHTTWSATYRHRSNMWRCNFTFPRSTESVEGINLWISVSIICSRCICYSCRSQCVICKMDKSCTLEVRRIEMLVGNSIYFGILLICCHWALLWRAKCFSFFRFICSCLFTSTSKHLCISERNNPEDLSSHRLRGGSLK